MKSPVLFDIDNTLIDTVRVKFLTIRNLASALNTSQNLLNKVVQKYTNSLKSSSDFDPSDYLKVISNHFGKDSDELNKVFYNRATYSLSLFSEVREVLIKLGVKNKLGVFSEGFSDFQTQKLLLTDIYKYFDKDIIFIFRRKMTQEALDKLPVNSVIIEDNRANAETLQSKGLFKVFWLNRKDDSVSPKAETIFDLEDLTA